MSMDWSIPKRLTFLVLVLACLAGALLISCAPSTRVAPGEEVAIGQTTFAEDREDYPPENGLFPEYRLNPGDVLDVLFQIESLSGLENYTITSNDVLSIKFVHTPELNETQQVRPDGNISLGYLGDVAVVGKTPQQLKEELEEAYGVYFRDPQVYVTVDEYRARIKELKKDLHTASRGLSRLVTVRPDGYCTFPLAGDVLVGHRTLPEVRDELDTWYGNYLDGLHVDLFLQEHAGSVIYVLGHVENSGSYMITKPITVLEAMALAGGPRDDASYDAILVFRKSGTRFVSTRVEMDDPLRLAEGSELFYLMPDDIVFVPRNQFYDAAAVMQALAQIVLFRGWSISFDAGNVEIIP